MVFGSNYSGQRASSSYLDEIDKKGSWMDRLQDAINSFANTSTGNSLPSDLLYADPPNGWESLGDTGSPAKGYGYWDGPGGTACHFCEVIDGRLDQYQFISGANWNASGKDRDGKPGVLEWSLVNYAEGTNIGASTNKSNPSPHDVEIDLADGTEKPIVERSVRVSFTHQGTTFYVEDIPKCDGSTEGYMWSHEENVKRGMAWIKSNSYIDYQTGKVYLYFKDPPELPTSDMNSLYSTISVDRYGYANSPVPASNFTDSGANVGSPNPLNILRTIRSYDPCLACSIHISDKKGEVGKYEVVPVAGWEVK